MPDLLHFPAIDGRRAVRGVSFEAETTADTYSMADAIGVGSHGYHGGPSGDSGEDGGRVYVEADSTCGAEVIFSRIALETEAGALYARQCWAAMRTAPGSRVSTRCGFHVHVDPRPCDFSTVASAYHLWNGVEDVMYRLGGAGWGGGHRGTGYCEAVPKGLDSHVKVGAGMRGQRYYGLNLSNTIRAMLDCRCGALQYGAWSECTCPASKPTIEVRVWNGTRNMRKAHAFVALSLALVAEADRVAYSPKRCGLLEYRGMGATHTPSRTEKALRRVLEWPMTAFDRDQVMALVRDSTLPGIIGPGRMSAIEERYGIEAVALGSEV